MRRPAVLLFDIDGTILDSGGAGRRAMERAFEACTGRRDACLHIRFAGMTDPAIALAGLGAVGAQRDESAVQALIDAYLAALADEVPRAPGYRVHEGVVEALDRAAEAPRVAVGLGTGNVREGARLKLGRAGLFERFRFGGFGCDHVDRAVLLSIGAARGAAALGASLESCRVVVIGDTPKDVAAARALGADCVAVATGGYTVSDLSAAGATLAVPDLRDPRALEALFEA